MSITGHLFSYLQVLSGLVLSAQRVARRLRSGKCQTTGRQVKRCQVAASVEQVTAGGSVADDGGIAG